MILFDLAARTVLLPVLVVQALMVRRQARRLPEAAGPRAGVTGEGPRLDLLIFGDSSAAGVGVAQQSEALSGRLVALLSKRHEVNWQLDAQTGRTTKQALPILAALPPAPLDVAVVALGVNDVTRLAPRPVWIARQRRLIEMLRGRGARLIILTAVPPLGRFPLLPNPLRWVLGRQASRFDRGLRHLAGTAPDLFHLTIPVADPTDTTLMAADGFHPAAPLYTLWAAAIADRIGRMP